jgi:hypothetical protein
MPDKIQTWREVGLSTTTVDQKAAHEAVASLYRSINREMPEIVLFARSPSEAIRWILKHEDCGWPFDDYSETSYLIGQMRDCFLAEAEDVNSNLLPIGGHWHLLMRTLGNHKTLLQRAIYGQHEAPWLAALDRDDAPDGLRFLISVARSCGWVWPLETAAIICDRPEFIHVDAEGRLHSPDGPAMRFRDGFCIFAWHGELIPRLWIEGDMCDLAEFTASEVDYRRSQQLLEIWQHRIA